VARQLARLKVDVIEAGFPASSPRGPGGGGSRSPGRYAALWSLLSARAVEGRHRGRLGKGVRFAERPRIPHSPRDSDVHLQHKFHDPEESCASARKLSGTPALSARMWSTPTEDAGGTATARYLFQVIEAVIDAGATVVNIGHSGYAGFLPQWARLITEHPAQRAQHRQGDSERAFVHNDLGMPSGQTRWPGTGGGLSRGRVLG